MRNFAIIILLLALSVRCYAPNSNTIEIIALEPIEHLTIDHIKLLLIEYDIKHPDIVIAQIRLETGNLSSKLCKNNKNLFGMKYPKKRKTTAIGEQSGHANYASYIDCIKDYAIWQQSRYKGGDYYTFLKDIGYATDVEYINKVKSCIT